MNILIDPKILTKRTVITIHPECSLNYSLRIFFVENFINYIDLIPKKYLQKNSHFYEIGFFFLIYFPLSNLDYEIYVFWVNESDIVLSRYEGLEKLRKRFMNNLINGFPTKLSILAFQKFFDDPSFFEIDTQKALNWIDYYDLKPSETFDIWEIGSLLPTHHIKKLI